MSLTEILRNFSDVTKGNSQQEVGTSEVINNTFNITGANAKDIADEVSRVLQIQVDRRKAKWALWYSMASPRLDAGVVIQTPPVYEFPSRRSEVIQIQGKNGDIVIDKNSFNNVNREYNLASVFQKKWFVYRKRTRISRLVVVC